MAEAVTVAAVTATIDASAFAWFQEAIGSEFCSDPLLRPRGYRLRSNGPLRTLPASPPMSLRHRRHSHRDQRRRPRTLHPRRNSPHLQQRS